MWMVTGGVSAHITAADTDISDSNYHAMAVDKFRRLSIYNFG